MKLWVAVFAALALAVLLFVLTSPSELPPETTVPEAVPIPTAPTTTSTTIEPPAAEEPPRYRISALPDGTPFSVVFDPDREEEVTGGFAAIMVELEDGAIPAGVVTFDLDGSGGENPGGYGSFIYTFSALFPSVTVSFYEEAWEALGSEADVLFTDAISGDVEAGSPVLRLKPPFRWAADTELPFAMEVTFETFAVRRGCDDLAVACSPLGGVQVIPLDRLYSIAPVWDGARVSIESPAPRPVWHPSYLDPGPLAPRTFPDVMWTGSEMIVWGGNFEGFPFPSLTDGAAYDPETGEWRMLAPAPLSEGTLARAVWADGQMIVVSADATLSYDPEADTWREIAAGWPSPSFVGQMVWTGEAVYLWDAGDLARLDPDLGEWRRIPDPPFEGRVEARLWAVDGSLLAAGTSGTCEGLELVLWSGPEWQTLPPIPDLPGLSAADCGDSRQVAVIDGSILVWYYGVDAYSFNLETSEWSHVGEPAIEGTSGASGALVLDGRVLIPERGYGTLYDPTAGTWTRVLLPGWGRGQQMVWTSEEVLMWGLTQRPESGAPVDAWRWTPPEP
jgi:hypothetical protein